MKECGCIDKPGVCRLCEMPPGSSHSMPVADVTVHRTEQVEEISSRSADYICDPGSMNIRGSGFAR